MNNLSAERNAIKELIALGQGKGFLTYKEIADALEGLEMSEEQVDQVYREFSKLGIDVLSERQSASGAFHPQSVKEPEVVGEAYESGHERVRKSVLDTEEEVEDEVLDEDEEDEAEEA